MTVYSQTDTGKVRSSNQDAAAQGSFTGGCWGVVCDGMGGANGGDIASRTAVEAISAELAGDVLAQSTGSELRALLEKAAERANSEVFKSSRNDPALFGMGTTMVLAVVKDNTLYTAHAGDSRAYLISDGRISQVTRDHSMVQELVDLGRITEQEARVHPRRNVITRALGVYEHIELDHTETSCPPGSIVLLCSDGLSGCVEDEQLLKAACELPPQELCGRYIAEANENGGPDNITALIICN